MNNKIWSTTPFQPFVYHAFNPDGHAHCNPRYAPRRYQENRPMYVTRDDIAKHPALHVCTDCTALVDKVQPGIGPVTQAIVRHQTIADCIAVLSAAARHSHPDDPALRGLIAGAALLISYRHNDTTGEPAPADRPEPPVKDRP